MDAELTRLLGYLDQDGVTELVLGSGQPITVRRGGAYTAASTEIVSRAQLARWLLGSGFEHLLPSDEGIGEPADIEVGGGRRFAVQISRRGEDLLVRVERAKAAPSAPAPSISARTRSRALVRPTSSPSLPAVAEPAPVRPTPVPEPRRPTPVPAAARAPVPQPPSLAEVELNPPSVLELGPPDLVMSPDPSAGDHYSTLPDLMPDLPLALVDTDTRPTRDAVAAPGDFELDHEDLRGSGTKPIRPPTGVASAPVRGAPPAPLMPVREDMALRGDPAPPAARPSEPAMRPVEVPRTVTGGRTPPAEGPVARAPAVPRTRSTDSNPALARPEPPAVARTPSGGAPRARSLRDADEKPNVDLIAQVVRAARARGASDLHIAANRPLLVRAIGELVPLDRTVLPASDVESLLLPLLGAASRETLATRGYVDIAIDIPDAGRLRGNVSRQQGGLKGSFRLAYPKPPTLDELNLPRELAKLVSHHQGLVVFAGPSGHGKTTTLAALVDLINSTRPHHILTIEDPVEIEHPRKVAVVSQREVGRHTRSFATALKASLREDPDVIVIGELRDRETVEIALTAAETGHLVMATMSTPSAAKTIDRLIDMFPPDDQQQVRSSLAGALRAIVAQRLVPRADNGAVLPAIELLTGVLPLISLIRDNKLYQLPNLMQRGRAFGMIRLDDSLAELVRGGMIAEEAALRVADNKRELLASLRGPLTAAAMAPPGGAAPAAPAAPAAGGGTAAPAKKGGLGSLFGRKDRE